MPHFHVKLKLFGIILLMLLPSSCKDDRRDYVPYVRVNLDLGLYTDLANLGIGMAAMIEPIENHNAGMMSFPGTQLNPVRIDQQVFGNGLYIYRAGEYDYLAFDRTCTFNAMTDYCKTILDEETGLLPYCPCCSSVYVLPSYGDVQKGPAALPLLQYETRVGSGRLLIRN